MEIHSLGVVGGGQMGNGIAHVAAAAGCSVVLVDVDEAPLEKARGTIQKNLEREVAKGKRTAEERDAALGRITLTTRARRAFLRRLRSSRRSSRTRRSRRSSSAGSTRPAAGGDPRHEHLLDLDHPARGGDAARGAGDRHALHEPGAGHAAGRDHPRPGDLGGDRTTPSTRWRAGLGKTPVEVQRLPGLRLEPGADADDQRGHVRLHEGVATQEAIDSIMKLGMNHPMGPLALADLIGLDVCLDILRVLHEGFGDPQVPAVPAARQDGRRGLSGEEDGRGIL